MDRPLRFAMVTTFYPPYNFGGDGIFVHRLANELARRGHHVTVIHSADAYNFLAGHEPAGSYDDRPNIAVHALRSRFSPLSLLVSHQTGRPALYAAELRRLLHGGFDVIHYHNVSLVGGPGVLAIGRALKLYTMHEYWLGCPTHVLFRFNRAPCTARLCPLCSLSYGRPPQWWRYTGLLEAAARQVDLFLAPSRFLERKHREFGLTAPIVHMPNFVPGPEDSELLAEAPAASPYFLFAGRLERLKGLHTLIPVFRRYRRARLVVAGTGGGEAQLRNMARGCDNIEFLGHVAGGRLDALLRGASALLLPSVNFESSPLVVLEAFSQQTPAIVRGIGAMPEAIQDSGAGFIYQTDEDLIRAMDTLLDVPSLRRDLGLRGRAAWARSWSPAAHLERYLGLVAECLERSQPPRLAAPPTLLE